MIIMKTLPGAATTQDADDYSEDNDTFIDEQKRLYNYLMTNCGYEKSIRPVYNASEPVHVKFDILLNHIYDLVSTRQAYCTLNSVCMIKFLAFQFNSPDLPCIQSCGRGFQHQRLIPKSGHSSSYYLAVEGRWTVESFVKLWQTFSSRYWWLTEHAEFEGSDP